jgi:hypothetical protein
VTDLPANSQEKKMSESFGVTAYDPYERFFGSRYRQGGRTVYSLDLSVRELVAFLPKPDPNKPLDNSDTQRRIYPEHARSFANYVEEQEDWVCPALLLRGPDIFEFKRAIPEDTGTTQFGVLGIPKDAKTEIKILDGQHRTLGFHLAWEAMTAEIQTARADLAAAKSAGEQAVVDHYQAKLDKLLARREHLAQERVSVQIIVTDDPKVAKRMFVDINDNAKGITGSVRSRFDDRKVITRALDIVLGTNELIKDRVDLQLDRVSGNSTYLLGAKHVADILRALAVGNGRVGKRLEQELDEKNIANEFEEFTAALVQAFPELAALKDGALDAPALRQKSLLGSTVILRALAAAWHELKEDGWSADEIAEAYEALAPGMVAPVYPDAKDTWFATGLFPANESGAISPTSRAQDLKRLSGIIADWCKTAPEWHRA